MSHHPDKIKNPARMHLSYAPFGTLNIVGLGRKDPASNGAPGQLAGWGRKPGLSPLRSQPPIIVILSRANGVPGQLAGWGRKNPRICLLSSPPATGEPKFAVRDPNQSQSVSARELAVANPIASSNAVNQKGTSPLLTKLICNKRRANSGEIQCRAADLRTCHADLRTCHFERSEVSPHLSCGARLLTQRGLPSANSFVFVKSY
jgi:hypothetical protein